MLHGETRLLLSFERLKAFFAAEGLGVLVALQ